jgi:hypothetical protein
LANFLSAPGRYSIANLGHPAGLLAEGAGFERDSLSIARGLPLSGNNSGASSVLFLVCFVSSGRDRDASTDLFVVREPKFNH